MIEIPTEQKRYFQYFVSMSSEMRVTIIDILRKAESPLNLSVVSSTVARALKAEKSMANGLLSVLLSLYGTYERTRLSASDFASQIMDAAESIPNKLTKAHWRDFERQVKEILTMEESLGVTSKAIEIGTNYERPFSEAKVMTDLRPIFHSNPSMKPVAATLVHVLKIKYFEAHEEREIFFALDSNDIANLQKELSRAAKKEETLKGYFKETGLRLWEITDNDNDGD